MVDELILQILMLGFGGNLGTGQVEDLQMVKEKFQDRKEL